MALLAVAGLLFPPATPVSRANAAGGNSTYTEPVARLELLMLDEVNHDRLAAENAAETRYRARPLLWDDRLAAVARAHSQDMARNGFFSHEGSGGTLPWTRVSKAGITWRATGENIFMGQDVAQAESAFMNEPRFQQNHRGNILNPVYTHVGIGIYRSADGTLYITQDFVEQP